MGLLRLLGGFHAATQVLAFLFIYNVVCLLVFGVIYYNVGFDKHFNLPDDMDPSFKNCMYYSLATQATCMAGEVTPKTSFGRGVLSFQITSAFLTTMVLVVPWIRSRVQ